MSSIFSMMTLNEFALSDNALLKNMVLISCWIIAQLSSQLKGNLFSNCRSNYHGLLTSRSHARLACLMASWHALAPWTLCILPGSSKGLATRLSIGLAFGTGSLLQSSLLWIIDLGLSSRISALDCSSPPHVRIWSPWGWNSSHPQTPSRPPRPSSWTSPPAPKHSAHSQLSTFHCWKPITSDSDNGKRVSQSSWSSSWLLPAQTITASSSCTLHSPRPPNVVIGPGWVMKFPPWFSIISLFLSSPCSWWHPSTSSSPSQPPFAVLLSIFSPWWEALRYHNRNKTSTPALLLLLDRQDWLWES